MQRSYLWRLERYLGILWLSVAGCQASTRRNPQESAPPIIVQANHLPDGGFGDLDHDGVLDPDDNCVATVNPDQIDRDGDRVGDACDVCPDVFDPSQEDHDGDGIGDACQCDGDEEPEIQID